jgi:carbonic anhydrase/acetyltransferase-like protein (isoleucine patch superfamily)
MAHIRSFRGISPQISAGAFVDTSAVVIGDVTIGEDSSLWPNVVARGDVHFIRIGRRTNVQDGSVIHVTQPYPETPDGFPVVIGDEVTIGHNAVIHGCTIEDRCLIGMSTTILDGAVVQTGTMVGAGALVTPGSVLESGYLYLGAPARKARPLTEAEIAWFAKSAANYVEDAHEHAGSKDD